MIAGGVDRGLTPAAGPCYQVGKSTFGGVSMRDGGNRNWAGYLSVGAILILLAYGLVNVGLLITLGPAAP